MGITYQHTQMLALNKVLHDYVDKNNFENILPTFDEILGGEGLDGDGLDISLDLEGNVITNNTSIIKILQAQKKASEVDDGKEGEDTIPTMEFISNVNEDYNKNNNIDYQNKLLQDAERIITFLENKGIMRGNAKDKIRGIEEIIKTMKVKGKIYDSYDETKWAPISDRIRVLRKRVGR